jgi:hypothetical protein
VNFDGENGPDWFAVLAKGSSSLADYVVFDLDGSGDGTAEIEFDGDYDVYLVVSPMDEDAQGYSYNWNNADEYGYSWDAELITSGSEDGGDEGGGSDDTDPDGSGASDGENDGFSLMSCGCSAGSLTGGLSMACLLGILGRVRRQR